ncbi:MAG: hypothetical protein ABSF14_05320 [Terriglobia bacterium]
MRTHSCKQTVYASLVPVMLVSAAARLQLPSEQPFRQQLASVYDRLATMKEWNSAEDLSLKLQVKELTNSYILGAINQATPSSAGSLEHDLNESFSQAIGHMSMEDLRKYWGDVHYASVLVAPWGEQDALVVGYMIPHGNTSLDVIEVAVHASGGGYQFVAEGGREMENHALQLTLMPRGSSQAIRFLAYGQRLSANQSPVGVVLYQFDGKSLAATWSRSDLRQGAVNTQGNKIILTYQDASHFEKGTPPYFLREEYELTSHGVKLASKRWVDSK